MVLELRGLGIPIRLRPGFLLIVCLLALGAREEVGPSPLRFAVFAVAIAIAVWFHELGHALPAARFGWEPVIELSLGLGVTVYHRRAFVARPGRLLLVAGGPAFGFLLAAVSYGVLLSLDPDPRGLVALGLGTLSTASAVWAAFSLLPVLPLDGGHLVAELASVFAPRHGYRVAATLSLVLCLAGLAFGLARGDWVLAALTALLAYRQKATLDSMRRVRDAEAAVSPRDAAYLALARNDAEAVVRHAGRAVEVADGTSARDEATYLLAWGHFLAGRPESARAALLAVSSARPRDYALEGAIAHDLGEYQRALELFEHALPRATRFAEPRMVHAIVETGRFREAFELFTDELGQKFSERGIATVQRAAYDAGQVDASLELGELLFGRTHDGSVAFLNACANARLERMPQARRWLERARDHGFRRLDALDDEPALEPLRKAPDWDELRRGFDA